MLSVVVMPLLHQLGGRNVTLNELHHGWIRGLDPAFGKGFSEPRIHAAVNSASVSCPDLRNEAYTAKRLDEQVRIAFFFSFIIIVLISIIILSSSSSIAAFIVWLSSSSSSSPSLSPSSQRPPNCRISDCIIRELRTVTPCDVSAIIPGNDGLRLFSFTVRTDIRLYHHQLDLQMEEWLNSASKGLELDLSGKR